jgi:class 3 adenylate cyclase
VSEGGPLSIVFAASHPDRTRSLIVAGSYVRSLRADDYPWAPTEAEYNGRVEALDRYWGRPVGLDVFAPSMQNDPHFKRWWANYLRNSATPGSVRALMDMNRNIDVRDVLPAVRTPTLILHRTADKLPSVEGARYMASRIPGARLVEFPGEDHLFFVGGGDDELAEIEQFVTGSHAVRDPDRVLATVLFTDIVDSTVRAAELGDSRWRDVLDAHHRIAAREITRYRGREVKSTGDGFLATFDGPARAVRCACAIRDAARSELNIELRAGLHTGEFEVMGDDIGGIAVHIGQRVSAMAGAGEVYVSSTVKDLTAGSGITFDERGVHQLKGVPGEWRIFAVAGKTA